MSIQIPISQPVDLSKYMAISSFHFNEMMSRIA